MFSGGLRRRWRDPDGVIYEWDYQHGTVEVYDARASCLTTRMDMAKPRLEPLGYDYWRRLSRDQMSLGGALSEASRDN